MRAMLQMESGKMGPGWWFVAGDLGDDVLPLPDGSSALEVSCFCLELPAENSLINPRRSQAPRLAVEKSCTPTSMCSSACCKT